MNLPNIWINHFSSTFKICSVTINFIGRAGRVSAGTCFRMVSREFYESVIPEFGIPEMQVCFLVKSNLNLMIF